MTRGASRIARWLAFGFLCLYALTAQRGVSWQDSGVFQLRILYRDLYGTDGIALAHPLYVLLTHAICALFGDFFSIEAPTAANIASGIWMAMALWLFHDCAMRLSRSRAAAMLATLTLGFSHLAWWLSTIAEVYTLSLCLLLAEARCVIRLLQGERSRRLFVGAAAFSGLGFAVHNFALLSLPVTVGAIAISIARQWHNNNARISVPSFLLKTALLFVVWASCAGLVLCPALKLLAGGVAPGQALSELLVGKYGTQVAGRSSLPIGMTIANFGIAAISLLSPCWLAGAVALRRSFGRATSLGGFVRAISPAVRYTIAIFIVHALFALRYRVPDQALFLLPTLSFAALLLAPLLSRIGKCGLLAPALLAVATVVYGVAMPIAANAVLHLPPLQNRIVASRSRILPFRDEVRYWALPWKHDESSAERFAAAAIAAMDAKGDASLFADSTSAPPLSLRIENASLSWHLYTPWNDCSRFTAEAIEGRQTFAVSPVPGYCPNAALATGNVKPLFP